MKRFLSLLSQTTEDRALAYFAIIALIGGGAHAYLTKNDKTTWKDIVFASIASSLAGFGAGSALLYLWGIGRVLLIFPIVAIAGWLGVVLLDQFSKFALNLIRGRLEQIEKAKDCPFQLNGKCVIEDSSKCPFNKAEGCEFRK